MPIKKFLAIALMALVSLLPFGTAFAENSKTVNISSKVQVNLALGNSLSGQTITFTLLDASGKNLGQSTVPADQALGSSLATFFRSVADAIKVLISPSQNADSTTSNAGKTQVITANNGSSSGGGGGLAFPQPGQSASPN